MKENDLLSIPEFAKASGKTKQGLYQQVKNSNSKIAPFVIFKGKTPYIQTKALKEVYGIEQTGSKENQPENQEGQDRNQESQSKSQEVNQDSQPINQEGQDKNQDSQDGNQAEKTVEEQGIAIISFLQEQLKEKDRQLAEKDKQIEKIQQLLDQEQQLHARTTYLLTEYQKKEEQEKQEETEDDKEPQEQDQETDKKRSWLYRFFFGDD